LSTTSMGKKSSLRTVLVKGSILARVVEAEVAEHHLELAEVTSTEDIKRYEDAKVVGDALQQAYPDHMWAVSWQGGAIVVKNLAIPGNYGMILDNAEQYSATAMKRDAVMKAGELLERCGFKRGRWNGEMATSLDKHGAH
jgi:hypothetical protein